MLKINWNKCFIIGNPRSGTTQLCSIILSHPKIKRCAFEKFLDYYTKNQNTYQENLKVNLHKCIHEFDLLKEIMTTEKNLSFIRNYLLSLPITIARTLRHNKTQQAVSACVAQQTQHWHKKNEIDYVDILKQLKPIPIKQIKSSINYLNNQDKILDTELKNRQHIVVHYEKFYFGSQKYQKQILIGIFESMNLTPLFNEKTFYLLNNGKLNSNETYKMIPNVNEIDETFSNEQNGHLFQEY